MKPLPLVQRGADRQAKPNIVCWRPRQTGFLRTIGPDETFRRLASFAKMEFSSLDNRVAPQVAFHQI